MQSLVVQPKRLPEHCCLAVVRWPALGFRIRNSVFWPEQPARSASRSATEPVRCLRLHVKGSPVAILIQLG